MRSPDALPQSFYFLPDSWLFLLSFVFCLFTYKFIIGQTPQPPQALPQSFSFSLGSWFFLLSFVFFLFSYDILAYSAFRSSLLAIAPKINISSLLSFRRNCISSLSIIEFVSSSNLSQ